MIDQPSSGFRMNEAPAPVRPQGETPRTHWSWKEIREWEKARGIRRNKANKGRKHRERQEERRLRPRRDSSEDPGGPPEERPELHALEDPEEAGSEAPEPAQAAICVGG